MLRFKVLLKIRFFVKQASPVFNKMKYDDFNQTFINL